MSCGSSGMSCSSSGMPRGGSGMSRGSSGMSCGSSGMSRGGSGMSSSGTGMSRGGSGRSRGGLDCGYSSMRGRHYAKRILCSARHSLATALVQRNVSSWYQSVGIGTVTSTQFEPNLSVIASQSDV